MVLTEEELKVEEILLEIKERRTKLKLLRLMLKKQLNLGTKIFEEIPFSKKVLTSCDVEKKGEYEFIGGIW